MRTIYAGLVVLLAAAGCTPNKGSLSDNFDDNSLNVNWNSFTNGCVVEESDEKILIKGTTEIDGWGNGNGISTKHVWPEGDFDVFVDFMSPEFSGTGTRLIYLMATDSTSEEVGIFYSFDIGYRVQTWKPRQFSDWLKPFGDEENTYHRMRLIYDSETEVLTGLVDDKLVGSLQIEMEGDVSFTIQAASETSDMGIDVRFDNFTVAQ
jgi:hypothetical protein